MRFEKNGRSGSRLWILCTICALLLGICFDSVQADSSLAYRDFAEAACDSGEYAGASALGAAKKGIPAQQAYVSETRGQGNNAIIPRRSARRTVSGRILGSVFGILSAEKISLSYFFGPISLFTDGLCEIISNTVILQYIHGQDGEKATFLLYS